MSESWEFAAETTETPEAAFPWPPPDKEPLLPAFGATWRGATFDPGRFFGGTPRAGGTGAALLFYLAVGMLVAGATLFWDSMPFFADAAMEETWADFGYGGLTPLVRFLLAPAILMAGLYISAGVVHLFLLMFGGATHGIGTTVRVFCYGNSPTLFGVVPIVGPIVGGVWSLVISIIGLREAHETESWKAVLAVLIPVVISVGFLIFVMFAAFVATGSMLPTG